MATMTAASAATLHATSVCYHCGLPLGTEVRRASVGGAPRDFCCPGCEAAAQAIAGAGLDGYYALRERAPDRPAPLAPESFAAYDDRGFQQTFVTQGADGACEAALLIEGVRCAACVWLNEQVIGRLDGVSGISINYATRRAQVRWNPERIRLSEILGAVARIGYRAHPFDPARPDALHRSERRRSLWRLFVAGFGMMQVMMYAVPTYLAGDGTMTADITALMRWASLLLTLPVVAYSAAPFFRAAQRDLRNGRAGMDVPVALGIAVAFGASVYATLAGEGEVYFDSVTMFVFLLLAGRHLELEARQRAAGALDYLARLVPAMAARVAVPPSSAEPERVPVAALRAGDVVLVRPGERVPADGAVVEGDSTVSEALLTGESRPQAKSPGSAVVGGSVNQASPLLIRVERVGGDTVLAQIARLVERAAAERQPLADLADVYARRFVVAVLVIAALTAMAWAVAQPAAALWVAVSVLVVTCPCALSLATPVALTVATGEMARRGLVVTRGHAIEMLARATDVVFDKTGTLTAGETRLTRTDPLGGLTAAECVAVASALEAASEHPIARAFARAGGERPPVEARRHTPGAGLEGRISGELYRIGTAAYCAEIAGGATPPSEEAEEGAGTTVLLARTGEWLARFTLADAIRADAPSLVAALQQAGRTVHLLSGDGRIAVENVARALGIDRWHAEASPEAKQAYVKALQGHGRIVVMVGDGVNDAPVIAQADVSVAMGTGAELAQLRADAVLLSASPAALAACLALASRTLAVIRQNLLWATAYNVVAIPAAALGFVTPWLAGIGMSGSSLAVVLNALRLRAGPPASLEDRRG